MTASVFSNLLKELTTVPPSFKCVCSQIFSQVCFHTFRKILVLNSRTQLIVCRLWYKLKAHDALSESEHISYNCALAVSLFSAWFSVLLYPAECMIHGLLTGPSPPSAAPPTSDHHSTSTRELVHDTSGSTALEKLNLIWSES